MVERILIHLERQTSRADFGVFGAARGAVLQLPAGRVRALRGRPHLGALGARRRARAGGADHFDGGSLARSYLELSRRGHVAGNGIASLAEAYSELILTRGQIGGASELNEMVKELVQHAPELPPPASRPRPRLDYTALVRAHNRRRR